VDVLVLKAHLMYDGVASLHQQCQRFSLKLTLRVCVCACVCVTLSNEGGARIHEKRQAQQVFSRQHCSAFEIRIHML
jgi:hypothetical protein